VATEDSPGVIAPPPLIYAVAFLAALGLHALSPMPILNSRLALLIGFIPLLLGLAIVIPGRNALAGAGTNVNPMRPTTTIVTSGPYRFTRNPLYVGLTLMYCGLTLGFNTWWGFILLVPVLIVMHLGVVQREERYLEQKFGEPYRKYKSTVRRYF
jgi:protein-S-isoprenylcysteine O-methyltransferase Ste14